MISTSALFELLPQCRALTKYLLLPAVHRRRQVRLLPKGLLDMISTSAFFELLPQCRALTKFLLLPAVHRRHQVRLLPKGTPCVCQGKCSCPFVCPWKAAL